MRTPALFVVVVVLSVLSGFSFARRGHGHAPPPCVDPSLCIRTIRHDGARYTVAQINTLQHPVLLFAPPGGTTLAEAGEALARTGDGMAVGMNAGMYEPDFSMVGLAVQDGALLQPLNRRRAGGNFYLSPNGVFFVDAQGPHVLPSDAFAKRGLQGVTTATQSGPMLLLPSGNGQRPTVHRSLSGGSRSMHTRNAVGVRGQTVFLVISADEVTLHALAVMMRDRLECEAALYLDGTVSALQAGPVAVGGVARRFGGVLYVPGRG